MTIQQFVKKYGPHCTSLVIKQYSDLWENQKTKADMLVMANDLREALEDVVLVEVIAGDIKEVV